VKAAEKREATAVTFECPHEQDVLDALAAKRWPARCDEELRAHVAACTLCTDLIEVSSALLDEQESAWHEARVPPSSVVWWRAQIRAREEAARSAARPVAFMQGVAASLALWIAVVVLRALPWPEMPDWRGWVTGLVPSVSVPDFSTLAAAVPGGWVLLALVLVLGTWLVLAPVAIYFAATDE
jgi:hypothetical protein